jgi:membrane protein required for colicin V production
MWLDTIVLAILACFAIAGLLRGGLAAGMSVAALAVAYAVAILGAAHSGPAMAERLGLPEILGVPVAGAVLFLVAYFAMGVVSSKLTRWERRRRIGPRSLRDRFLGGCFGLLRGGLIALLLSMLAIWLDALRATGTADFLPELGASRAAAVTESVVETGVEAALSDARAGGRFVARMAARPGASIADLQAVLDNPHIGALQDDRLFWTQVEDGAVDSALNQKSFLAVTHDEELRAQLAALGLVDEEAGRDPQAFRATAEEVLREVGPRIRGLRSDPELKKLIEDPEVASLIESGDTLALLGHRGFRDFVAHVARR